MRLRAALAATIGGALVLAAGLVDAANAEAICTHDMRVLAQPRDELTLLEKYKDEFKRDCRKSCARGRVSIRF